MLLEPPDQALDRVPMSVERLVEHRRAAPTAALSPRAQLPLRDHRPDPMRPEPRPDPLGVVAPVSDQALRAPRRLDESTDGLELGRLAPLPAREVDREREPVPVADDVELRAQPPPAPPERLVRAPLFRAPAAAREARITVPSTIHVE